MLDLGLWNERIEALYALGNFESRALPLLTYATEDNDWQVRLTAVHFLGKLGPEAAPALSTLARREPCPSVRLAALRWLQFTGKEIMTGLKRALDDKDEDVRLSAVLALERLNQ